jgi:signal peptidase I
MIRWFLSKTVRQAGAMRKHVEKILNHQRDLLSPQAVSAVETAMRELQRAAAGSSDAAALEKQMEALETAANKWLKPYPNAAWRENVEVLLVALTVAMGIRTFFLQPFKIPTGSMQPTLFGVTSVPDFSPGRDPATQVAAAANLVIPGAWQRVCEWFAGVCYLQLRAKVDGRLERVNPPVKFLIFNILQTLEIGGSTHWMLFPPDYGGSTLEQRAGLHPGQFFKQGEEVVRMKIASGDHLFVDRVNYNFRAPRRGEIIVFETKGIPEERRYAFNIPGDQFYIKRLVALGGEHVQIGNDRHLIIDGRRLDDSTPHFEKVYSCNPNDPPRESHYSGHVDGNSPYFSGKPDGVPVPPGEIMVMGDNTMNSLDSRYWGPFPATYVIGKSFFVYWPFTERFGWGYHR